MGKRIFLFVLTNIAIVLTLSIVVSLLGVTQGYTPGGLDLSALAMFCLIYGMGGAFISLLISRWVAKRATGVNLVDGRSGDPEADWLYATVRRLTQRFSYVFAGRYGYPTIVKLEPLDQLRIHQGFAVTWTEMPHGPSTRRP